MADLLDANVLIALLDHKHQHYTRALHWFSSHRTYEWATCPLTENAVLRIFGNPNYLNGPGTPERVRWMLDNLAQSTRHVFWPDDLSLIDTSRFPILPTSRHLTDLYLLALAVSHGGQFFTFDRQIDPTLVVGGPQAYRIL